MGRASFFRHNLRAAVGPLRAAVLMANNYLCPPLLQCVPSEPRPCRPRACRRVAWLAATAPPTESEPSWGFTEMTNRGARYAAIRFAPPGPDRVARGRARSAT